MATGLGLHPVWSKAHFIAMFFGVNVTFLPMHFLGMAGIPRRVNEYRDSFHWLNLLCS